MSVARRSKVAFRLGKSRLGKWKLGASGLGASGLGTSGRPGQRAGWRAAGLAAGLALAVALGCGPAARADEITERVVVDPNSGIAIFGYDPVGYFLEHRPVPGRPEHEWVWHNAVWRFASVANLEEFKRTPESFAPAYGGYDADSVTRGVATFPDPTVFAIADDRLFLFRSEDVRGHFLESGGIAVADRAWPALSASLRP